MGLVTAAFGLVGGVSAQAAIWTDSAGQWVHVDPHAGRQMPYFNWIDEDATLQAQAGTAASVWDAGTILALPATGDFSYAKLRLFDGHYGYTGWAGLAHAHAHAPDGYAEFNLTYAATGTAAYKAGLVCHEVGHLLGLAHEGPPSCMAIGYDPAAGSFPTQTNFDEVNWWYTASGH
ncbi:MAG TPA: hypothetical protein VIL49_00515 [Capillimicrobium sp.]